MHDLKPDLVLESRTSGSRIRIAEVRGDGSVRVHWGQSADDHLSLPIVRHVFADPDLWRIVEPYVCGACGHRFYEDTPAGRCPKEADHEPEPEPTWNVYALWEGTVDAEESFEHLTDAALKFAEMVTQYQSAADAGQLTADVTVHMYHPGWGVMEAERHISAGVTA